MVLKRSWHIILLALFFLSCEKQSDLEQFQQAKTDEFHGYVYALFKQWYYWSDEITGVDYQGVSDYNTLFSTLKNNRVDRWSFIQDEKKYLELLNSHTYFGLGARFTYDIDNHLRVAYVYESSPLGVLGIERGWEVLSIDGQSVSLSARFKKKIQNIGRGGHDFVMLDNIGQKRYIRVAAGTVHIDNILEYKIITSGQKNIGYLALGAFDKSDKVDVEKIFTFFSNNQVRHLVLDLRYNSGGDIQLVNQIAGHILGPQHVNKLLYTKKHNYFQKEADKEILVPNLSCNLNTKEIIVITGSATGSASELLINVLSPYIRLKIVGQRTAGKPFGMYVWNYEDKVVGLVAFKMTNSLNKGDYINGFSPNSYVFDDIDHPLGNPREACLQEALYYIDHGRIRYSKSRKLPTTDRFLYHGIAGKQGGY